MPRKAALPKHADPRPLAERRHADRKVTVNLSESPLSWLHARGHLSDVQLLAGEKLRGDYEASGMGPAVTMRWDAVAGEKRKRGAPDHLNPTERMIAAKRRFDAALVALGPDLADIAWRVICAGESMPPAENALSWPARSGKLVLRIALDRLAGFYRLPGRN